MDHALTVQKVAAVLRRVKIRARIRPSANDPAEVEVLCPDRDTQEAAATILGINRFDVRFGPSTATMHTLICSASTEMGNSKEE